MGYLDDLQETTEEEKKKQNAMQEYLAKEREALYQAKIDFESVILKEAEDHQQTYGTAYFLHTKDQLDKQAYALSDCLHDVNSIFSHIDEPAADPALQAERNDLKELESCIRECIKYTHDYAEITTGFDSGHVEETLKKEHKISENLEAALMKMNAAMDRVMLYDVSDKDEFRQVQSAALELTGLYESMIVGSLSVKETGFDDIEEKEEENSLEPENQYDDMEGMRELEGDDENKASKIKIPERPQYMNGKKVHYIDATGDNAPQVNREGPLPDITIDLSNQEETVQKRLNGMGFVSFEPIHLKPMGKPLFTHDPCPEDVYQGFMGDCYLMTSLASIAAKSPEKIKEMIRLSKDGDKATVRLFNHKGEPVYVTVDNSEYVINCKDAFGNEKEKEAFARGASWVKLVEKAFVASGLQYGSKAESYIKAEKKKGNAVPEIDPDRLCNDIEEGNSPAGTYNLSVGGYPPKALSLLLGEETAKIFEEGQKDNDISTKTKNPGYMIPKKIRAELQGQYDKRLRDYQQFPEIKARLTGQYSDEELDFFDKVKKHCEDGNMVTAGTHGLANRTFWDERPMEDIYDFHAGICPSHAYTVESVREDEKTGIKYIVVRDPHNQGGRKYDEKGNAYYEKNPKMGGRSEVELSDFMTSFSRVYSVNLDEKTANKDDIQRADDLKRLYGDALKDICSQLSSRKNFYRIFRCPSKFKEMRKAAKELSIKLNKKDAREEELRKTMEDLFEAADRYTEDCEKNYHRDRKMTDRGANRYFAAEIIHQIKEAYAANDSIIRPKAVSTDEMQNAAFELKEGDVFSAKAQAIDLLKGRLKAKKNQTLADKNGVLQELEEKLQEQSNALKKASGPAGIRTAAAAVYLADVKEKSGNLSVSVLRDKITEEKISSEADRLTASVNQALQTIEKASGKKAVRNLLKKGNTENLLKAVKDAWNRKNETVNNQNKPKNGRGIK